MLNHNSVLVERPTTNYGRQNGKNNPDKLLQEIIQLMSSSVGYFSIFLSGVEHEREQKDFPPFPESLDGELIAQCRALQDRCVRALSMSYDKKILETADIRLMFSKFYRERLAFYEDLEGYYTVTAMRGS